TAIRHYAEAEALFARPETAARARAIFSAAAARARERRLKLRLPRLQETAAAGCSWPWDGAYVTHRGDVQPCCMVMGSDRATLGSLRDAPFETIWQGEIYREFRRRLMGDDPP